MTSPYFGAFATVYVIVAVAYVGYVISLARRSRAVMDRIATLERTRGG
jgi:type VI protein secretion system component VasF